MAQAANRSTMTLEEYYRLPDDGRHHELQGGMLVREPLPNSRHGMVTATLVWLLNDHVRRHRLGVVMSNDAGFLLGPSPVTLRGPDVSFVSRERCGNVRDLPRAFPGPPDLAVEILSPSNRPGEIHAKVADYLAAGARLVWVVDPQDETVRVYRTLLEPRTLTGADVLEGEDVAPGFRVAVAELFEV